LDCRISRIGLSCSTALCWRHAEFEGAAAIAAQQVRADEVRYDGKLAPSEDEVQTRIDAITGPLNTQITKVALALA
jgi:hypothetical protein